MSLEKQVVQIIRQMNEEKRLGDKRAEQFYNLITEGGASDEKVAVDDAAVAGYLGAAPNDGVLRASAPLTYADGGDYVTLGFSHLGLESLADPGADRIVFWDDSEGALKWLQLGGGISIDTTPKLNIDHDAIDNFVADEHINWEATAGCIRNFATSGFVALKANAELRCYDNGNYVGFEAPALDADQIWVLPSADGNADEVLKTDGGGNLDWLAVYSQSQVDTRIELVSAFGLDDDEATSFTPTQSIGILLLMCSFQSNIDENAIIAYRTGTNIAIDIIAKGATSNVEVTTGVLDGTTGTDGKWTVSVHTDGKIYVENRMGVTLWWRGVTLY